MKKYIIYLFAMTMGFCCLSSCSEETAEDNEFENWSSRNEVFLASVVNDSLQKEGWMRVQKYALSDSVKSDQISDYVYVCRIDSNLVANAQQKGCPAFTDSVRVAYQGRLIPSVNYPQGKFFDRGTSYGSTFSLKTASTTRMKVSGGLVDGFATALQKMHVGDYWRVYIPSDLGYGDSGNGDAVPGGSVLVFDLILVDYSPSGQTMRPWQ